MAWRAIAPLALLVLGAAAPASAAIPPSPTLRPASLQAPPSVRRGRGWKPRRSRPLEDGEKAVARIVRSLGLAGRRSKDDRTGPVVDRLGPSPGHHEQDAAASAPPLLIRVGPELGASSPHPAPCPALAPRAPPCR